MLASCSHPTPTRPNRVRPVGREVLAPAAARRVSASSHATASRRASSISAWSRSRSPTRSVGRPDCRVPKNRPARAARDRARQSRTRRSSRRARRAAPARLAERRLIQQDARRRMRAAADAAAQVDAAATGRTARRARRSSTSRSATSTPTSTTVVDDQDVHVAARERGHDAILLVRLQPAVQQRDAVLGKHLGLQVYRPSPSPRAGRPSPTPRRADRST